MNINLPATPADYAKGWADNLTTAIKNAFGQVNAAGATITLPSGASLTLTSPDGRRWALMVDATGGLVVSAL